jgi:hypothetical protein
MDQIVFATYASSPRGAIWHLRLRRLDEEGVPNAF